VAMSNMGQDATNHFSSLLMSTGKDIISIVYTFIVMCI
jgi:hypothetical protein